jgi:hypothetical protein
MEENGELIKCEKCKVIKPKELINIKYICCNRCIIKEHLKNYLLHARIANYFKLSIDELNNILSRDMKDPTRDELGKHERYDEISEYYRGAQSYITTDDSNYVITDEVIDNFLDEKVIVEV